MPLAIRFQGGGFAGKILDFTDAQVNIVIGRDPTNCQVVTPPQDLQVGREHCAIRRELGRYILVTNGENRVLLDGREIVGHHRLQDNQKFELQMGKRGQILIVTPTLAESRDGNVLLPTADRVAHSGISTRLQASESRARRWIAVTSVAIVLGGIASAILLHLISDTKHQVAALINSVTDLSQLTNAERAAIAELDLAPAVRAAQGSVYLVLLKAPDGTLHPCGTAWVVDRDRGLLATNSHLAELHKNATLLDPDLPDNCPLMVRSPGDSPQDFEVQRVTMHPGYRQFSQLWSNFDPSRRLGERSLDPISAAGGACDVALLTVDGGDRLAPALKLASTETVAALTSATRIGLIGYPMEGIQLGGVNVDRPAPQLHYGNLSAITDFFGSPEQDAERQLLHHSAATAGGSSGSPILNAQGAVVGIHSAGTVIGDVEGVRIGSPAGIHYAQRVDLLQELLNGVAEDRQKLRLIQWERRIAQFFEPGRQVKGDWLIADQTREYQTTLSDGGEYDVTTAPLAQVSKLPMQPPDSSSGGVLRTTINLPDRGWYLVAANGQTDAALALTAKLGKTALRGTSPAGTDSVQFFSFQATGPDKLNVAVRFHDANDRIQFQAFHFTRVRKSVEDLHGLAKSSWAEALANEFNDKIEIREVSNASGELKTVLTDKDQNGCADRFVFTLAKPGRFLVSAVSSDEQSLRLHFDDPAPADFDSDTEATRLAAAFKRATPETISGLVLSHRPGVRYSLRLYVADLPAGG